MPNLENDHIVTTLAITVVHPADQSPAEIVAAVDDAIESRADSTWGLGQVTRVSSVGTHIGRDDDDAPDWLADNDTRN